ncbi:MAG TPA: hypothetical protein VJ246_01085 [Patescibacteria group bacterium]|nr:hypothetical protein [Patescibacteria group bacterium]
MNGEGTETRTTEWSPITLPEDANYADLRKAHEEGVDEKGRTEEELYPVKQALEDMPRAKEHMDRLQKSKVYAENRINYINNTKGIASIRSELDLLRSEMGSGSLTEEDYASIEQVASEKIRALQQEYTKRRIDYINNTKGIASIRSELDLLRSEMGSGSLTEEDYVIIEAAALERTKKILFGE